MSTTSAKEDKRSGWLLLGDKVFPHYGRIGAVSGILALASVLLAVVANAELAEDSGWLLAMKLVSAFWTLVPPVYFFLEYHWVRTRGNDKETEKVQESQKMAQRIWAAVVAALAVIYLKGGQ